MAVTTAETIRPDFPLHLDACIEEHVERRGTACIAQPSAGSLEEPVVKTMPSSPLLCQCLGQARRSSPVHTARTHWKLEACLRGRACTPCLTLSFTCLRARCHAHAHHVRFHVNAPIYGFVSCHVSRSQWPCRQPTMGWHEHWDALGCIGMHCAAVSTHLAQDSIGRKTSESIIQQHQALQPAPALSSSDLARPRSGHATSNLGNGSLGTQGQSYAFCPPQPTRRRLVDKTHPVQPLPSTMTSSFPPRRSRGPN